MVGVLVDGRERHGVDAVDPAAVLAVPDGESRAELVLDKRAAHSNARFVTRIPALGGGELGAAVNAGLGEAGLRRDVTHRAALGAGAEQRALRSAQHFHPLDVEGLGQRLVGVERERAHLDRRVVEIDAGRAGAAGPGDTTDGDVVGAGVVEVHSRREARHFRKILDATIIEALLRQRRYADGYLAETLRAARGGHDDFLQRPAARFAPRRLLLRPARAGGACEQCQRRARRRGGCSPQKGPGAVNAPHTLLPTSCLELLPWAL